MTIGEKLKNAREDIHLSLKEVQENIKIRTRYLEALENDQFDIIPGEAYVRAFIKGYANFLDLNYIELLEQYEMIKAEEKLEMEELQEKENKDKSPGNLIHNRKFISSIIIAVILIVIAFLIYNIFLLNDSKNNLTMVSNDNNTIETVTDDINLQNQQQAENNNIDSLSIDDSTSDSSIIDDSTSDSNIDQIVKQESLDINSEDSQTNIIIEEVNDNEDELNTDNRRNQILEDNINIDLEKNDDILMNKSEQKNIDIIVGEKSWIQIHIDDVKVFEGTLYKGDNKSYTYSENISMKIGNAAGITARRGNKVLGPWGEQGEVIKKTIED